MKILQISNRVPYPLNEGGNIGIYNYTRGFYEAGCDVTLLALQPKKHKTEQEEAEGELSKYARFKSFPINTDVKVVPALLNLFTTKSYNVERFYDKKFDKYLAEHLKSNHYDVVQIEGTYPAIYTETVRKNCSSVIALRQHNVEYQIWERLAHNASNPLKKWYFSLLAKRLESFEKRHLNIYDALVPVTPDDGDLFKQMGCNIPIFPSPAGIDMTVWKANMSSNPSFLYHIGSLEWMPNYEAVDWFLTNIWPALKKNYPKLEFFVAGKRMPEEMANRKIEGVHMLGEVPSAPDFIFDKGICVVPLLSGSGIRLKILEAMSAGKLVISSTIGAQGIDYTAGENLFIADSLEDYLEVFEQMEQNPDLMPQIQSAGQKLISKQYSNASVIDRLLAFYRSLTAKN